MSNATIMSIDPTSLDCVTGGTTGGTSRKSYGTSDQLLTDLGNLATQIKDVTNKTSGFSSTSLFLLMALTLQRNQGNANVVYVGQRGYW
jgi:hypothetical protein